VDEDLLVSEVISFLRRPARNRLMADLWAQGGSLRVARREPQVTSAGKILPLQAAEDR
jgi:hypothetical protein